MHPSYSPLFTWGLLAERCMGSSSRSSVNHSPSRCTPTTSSPTTPNDDDGSVFYFTLQPGKRDTAEFDSFLYLDLADHRSMTTTHRRKPSTLSKSTSWTCSLNANANYDLSRNEKPLKLMSPPPPPVLAHRRSSRESLRTIPSPKPVPSATLPELPIASQSPSSVPLSSALSTFSSHKVSHSAPTISSALLSSSGRTRRSSLRSESISSVDRRKSRMQALACLEGRSRAPHRIPRSSLRKNFMDLSDDDDDDDSVTRTTKSNSSSASQPAAPPIVIEDLSAFADVEDEADPVLPTRKAISTSHSKSSRSQKKPQGRKRRSTIDSWFPLNSFIDFNKDEDASSWNWRSFIEIGAVA